MFTKPFVIVAAAPPPADADPRTLIRLLFVRLAVVSTAFPSRKRSPSTTRLGGAKVPSITRSESPLGIVKGSGTTVPLAKVIRGVGTVAVVKRTVGVPVVCTYPLAPVTVPAVRSSKPFPTTSRRFAASAIVPVFVKLGLVPVCVTVRFPPTTSMSPLFRCAASTRLSVVAISRLTVPWFSSTNPSVRAPPDPPLDVRTPDGLLTSAPLVTLSVAA